MKTSEDLKSSNFLQLFKEYFLSLARAGDQTQDLSVYFNLFSLTLPLSNNGFLLHEHFTQFFKLKFYFMILTTDF
jgi:hypothetical protein